MTNETMTKRMFLEQVAEGATNEEITAFALAEIVKLDKANEAKKGKVSPATVAFNKEVDNLVANFPEDTTWTAHDIATALNVSIQKASALARRAEKNGDLVSEEVKAAKGRVKGYTLVAKTE
jgi:hypothetical protein